MNSIKCIAIDDEPLALDVIKDHVSKVSFLNIEASFQNPVEALNYLSQNKIDLIFLDIQMPQLTGFEFLSTLSNKPLVILTTAYPDYALKGYEVDAVDYLVKPIALDKFLKAVNKVQNLLPSENNGTPAIPKEETFFFVKTEYKTVKINFDEIRHIESQKDYVVFHLKDEKISSLMSITSVEKMLPASRFLRIHRSFIIAIDKIESIERNIVFINDQPIPVGESYRSIFKKLVDSLRMG